MKRYLFILAALLLVSGVAVAANIPMVVAPGDGPEIWTTEVYNDSGAALSSGSVVVWDYTDSDMYDYDLRRMYVTTSTTADDVAVAGIVVSPTIAAGDTGTIAIWGPVKARLDAIGDTSAGQLVGNSSTTAGRVSDFAGEATDVAVLGFCVDADITGDVADAYLWAGKDIAIVFVDISRIEEN